jgi:type II secretory pathway component GspD/PulD (secretin)
MIAEEAATELKPLISSYGQLFPMASSNRLEAMDAVVNLREIQKLLTRAESDESRRERVAEFQLKHRKADEVAVKLRQLLGLPPEHSAPTQDVQTQRDIEQLKFQAEAVKALGANAPQVLKEKTPNVRLVVNTDENSILVNGRPDKIEIARQAIEAMDKPEPPRESAWETFSRVKVYPLSGVDSSTITQLMQVIQRSGNVDKETRITHDPNYNRLIVYGLPEDQVTIAGIIETFRTEERRAEVLPLLHLDAEYATKAVKLVLKNPERPLAAPGSASDGRFQIEPDQKNKRLFLWATPKESKEVREFLAGLGEILADTPVATPQLHVVPLRGAKASVVAERLKSVWKDISDAPLVIESDDKDSEVPSSSTTPAAPPHQETPAEGSEQKPTPMSDRMAAVAQVQLASQQTPVTAPPPSPATAPPAVPVPVAAPTPAAAPEPKPLPAPAGTEKKVDSSVHVIADKDDEMIIVSRDPAAADVAKQFVEQVVPGTSDVQVIPLKHAQAAVVKMSIETMLAHTRTAQYSPLATGEPLVIEADSRINRLMVQHATPDQMRIINSVVPLIDQPEQGEDQLVRKQQIYRAKRKRASEIATVVKDVYRDLLSTSDKVFDARIGYRPYGYNQAMAATSKSPEYAGLLSIGIDDVGNSLVLSAPSYLIDEVMQVVKLVDESADNEKVAVISVTKAAKPTISDALNRLLNKR